MRVDLLFYCSVLCSHSMRVDFYNINTRRRRGGYFGGNFVQRLSPERRVGSRRGWHRWTGNSAIYKVYGVASASGPPFDLEIEKTDVGGVIRVI